VNVDFAERANLSQPRLQFLGDSTILAVRCPVLAQNWERRLNCGRVIAHDLSGERSLF
jgi:hypothetical protein